MNLGMAELVAIFVLALLVLGPKKLPEVGQTLGKALTEFRRASNGIRESITAEFNSASRDVPSVSPLNTVQESVNSELNNLARDISSADRPSTPEAGADLDAPKS